KLNEVQSSLLAERPAEFLFDVKNDPWETVNLINDPRARAVAKKMREQLSASLLKSRDVLFLPEYEIGLISEKGKAYEYRLSDQNYPFKEIFAAAALSGKRGADIASQQVELLKNTNKVVRYWAALGLRSQKADVLKPFEKQI